MRKVVCVLLTASILSACAFHQPQGYHSKQSYYLVQPQDNLYSIAFEFQISVEHLRRANLWLNGVNVAPGMRLSVPRILRHDTYLVSDELSAGDQLPGSNRTGLQYQRSNYIWPVASVDISSRYGLRRGHLHEGIDLRAPPGTSIYASSDGEVVFSGYSDGYGHLVVIDHGYGIETAYAHNSRNLVRKGQRVMQGQTIATVGQTGNATGFHVHFEVRRHGRAVDPARYLQAAM